jgi:hypothetical protein
MLVSSKEEMLFGAALIASGSGQLAYSCILSEYDWLTLGLACASLGVILTALGYRWTTLNPPGITVLGASWSFLGLLILVASVMSFTPLLFLAGVSFVLSWGLIRRKTWARSASLLATAVALSASIVTGIMSTLFPAAEIYPFLPSVVISVYVLWYLTRPHVAQMFDLEESTRRRLRHAEEVPNNRGTIAIATCFVLLTSFLAYSYSNPPSSMPIASIVYIRGSLGAGELGTSATGTKLLFWASRSDLLNCSFQCTSSESVHVWMTYNMNENTTATIFETISLEGSGSALAPQTGNYAMWITTQKPGQANVLCDIFVTSFSLRRPIVQSLILSLFGAAVAISLTLHGQRRLERVAPADA